MSTFVEHRLSEYNTTQKTAIKNALILTGLPTELGDYWISNFEDLALLEYHLIPLNSSIELNDTIPIIVHLAWTYLVDYSNILKLFKNEATQLTTMKPEQTDSMEHGHVVTTLEEKRNMSEDAPISTGVTLTGEPNYTIDTPRDRYNADNETGETHSGTDTETKKNPYYWEMFLRLLEKYNINKIVLNSVRYITAEFQKGI